MRSGRTSGATLLLGAVGASVLAAGVDWPQWRGPARDGVAPAATLPAKWPESLRRVWSIDIGEGQASPIVAGNRVFVHGRRSDREVVAALALTTGETLWQSTPADVPFKINPGVEDHGKGPKATPAFADGRLFTTSVAGEVTAWDAEKGVALWRHNASAELPSAFGGAGASPMILGRKLIVHLGDARTGALRALSVSDGKVLWSWEGDGVGYASPITVPVDGGRQVVTQSAKKLVGVDPDSGRLLWEMPYETHNFQNIVTPLEAEGLVIFSGVQAPTLALRLNATGPPATVWSNRRLSMYMNSPVTANGAVFGMAHQRRGQFFALDLRTGEVLWTTRGREGDNAMLLRADKTLFWLTDGGKLFVTSVSRQDWDPLAEYQLAESPTWAHPALVGSMLLIKDATRLTAWSWE